MRCQTCGHENAESAGFCNACGRAFSTAAAGNPIYAQPMAPGYGPNVVQRGTSGMAIAGFVLSFFCGVLGLIFSILGRNECVRSNGTLGGHGLATAGIVISIVNLALGVLYIIVVAVAVNSVSHMSPPY